MNIRRSKSSASAKAHIVGPPSDAKLAAAADNSGGNSKQKRTPLSRIMVCGQCLMMVSSGSCDERTQQVAKAVEELGPDVLPGDETVRHEIILGGSPYKQLVRANGGN